MTTPEVIQEGWFFVNNDFKSLYECWYQIYSDGLLAFRMNTNEIHKFLIKNIKFTLYDASSSLPTGCGMRLSYEQQVYYFIFDHILDLKRFCFGCYRTAQEGNNLQVCSFLSPSLTHHPPSGGRISYLRCIG
jgi:hypothetical protein